MKLKSFLISLESFVLATAFFYWLGSFFDISWLQFQYEYINDSNEFYLSIGSFVPVLIGLIISFITEKLYIYKYSKQDY